MTPEQRAKQILDKLELGPKFFGGDLESEKTGYKHEVRLVKEAIEAHSAELQAENNKLIAQLAAMSEVVAVAKKLTKAFELWRDPQYKKSFLTIFFKNTLDKLCNR